MKAAEVILMEKSTKIVIGVIVFGFVLPCATILRYVDEQQTRAEDLAGIRDYKAGHSGAAIPELSVYLKAYPLAAEHSQMPGKSPYAQYYLVMRSIILGVLY